MSVEISIDQKAPEFCLRDAEEKDVCNKDLLGKWVVLYFYPKDNTSGCTQEALDFTENIKKFVDMGVVIYGISPDSVKTHSKFIANQHLKVGLLSDEDKTMLTDYGVWQKKSMYGREYMGVVRSTFLVNPEGDIAAIWCRVKVKGHVQEVLDKISSFKKK